MKKLPLILFFCCLSLILGSSYAANIKLNSTDYPVPTLPGQPCPDGSATCDDGALILVGLSSTQKPLMTCDKYDNEPKPKKLDGGVQYQFVYDAKDSLFYANGYSLNHNGTPVGEANLANCVVTDQSAGNQPILSITAIGHVSSYSYGIKGFFIGMFIGGAGNLIPQPGYILDPQAANPNPGGQVYDVPPYNINKIRQFWEITLKKSVYNDGQVSINGIPPEANATTVDLSCTAAGGKTYSGTAPASAPNFLYSALHDAVAPNQPAVVVDYSSCKVSYDTVAQTNIPLGSFSATDINSSCAQHWCGTLGNIQTSAQSPYTLDETPVYGGHCADGSSTNPPCSSGTVNVKNEKDGSLNITGDQPDGKPPADMLPFSMICMNTQTGSTVNLSGNPGSQGLAYSLEEINSSLSNASSVRCVAVNRQHNNVGIFNLNAFGLNCVTANEKKWCATISAAAGTHSVMSFVPRGEPLTGQWCENTTEPCDQWEVHFTNIP